MHLPQLEPQTASNLQHSSPLNLNLNLNLSSVPLNLSLNLPVMRAGALSVAICDRSRTAAGAIVSKLWRVSLLSASHHEKNPNKLARF